MKYYDYKKNRREKALVNASEQTNRREGTAATPFSAEFEKKSDGFTKKPFDEGSQNDTAVSPVKRVTVFSGHFGSGKTSLAVNYAFRLRKMGLATAIADLDTVNPYFRTADSTKELRKAGIRVVTVNFAGTNADIPSVPGEIYSLVRSRSEYAVFDIGGDDMGAYALGGLSGFIKEENNFEHFFTVNFCRPLTSDAPSAAEYIKEIERACALPFTGIINNTNLGEETEPSTVLASVNEAARLSEITGLPLVMTSAEESVADKIPDTNIFRLELQKKYW